MSIRYLGRLSHPFSSQHITRNFFQLVIRDLERDEVHASIKALEEARLDGVANYFDDQRFGSVGASREFVARKLIDGDYEGALRLALVEPYEHDRAPQRQEKKKLARFWGDWQRAAANLPYGRTFKILKQLQARPTDFRRAFALLRSDVKALYLAAYQSYLWNNLLAGWIMRHARAEQVLPVRLSLLEYPMCRGLDEAQRARFLGQVLPLPSARLRLDAQDPLRELVDQALGREGLTLAQIRIKHLREPFFSKGNRPAFFVPEDVHYRTEDDELNRQRRKLTLSFVLPPGSYATLVVKRITAQKTS